LQAYNASGGKKITFVGDSITAFRDSPPMGWWSPMMDSYPNITSVNKGVGGDTTYRVIDRLEDIKSTNADMYVINIGVNDVRHFLQGVEGAETYCAKDTNEYIQNISTIVNYLKPADIHIVSIWPSFPGDPRGDYITFNNRIKEWNSALSIYCNSNDIGHSEVFNLLFNFINTPTNLPKYVPDGIHPNNKGKKLYSKAVLKEIL